MTGKGRRIACLLRLLGIVVISVVAILWLLPWLKGHSPEQFLRFVPKNPFLAAAVIWILHLLKTFVVVFPIVLLQALTGYVFPPLTALAINMAGLFITLSCGYLIGRYSAQDTPDKLLRRFPVLARLLSQPTHSEWFFSYIARVNGILPLDIVSMLMGSLRVRYSRYILGSMLGMLPLTVAATILGSSVTEPGSPAFILSCAALAAITVISLLIYWFHARRIRLAKEQAAEENKPSEREQPPEQK